MADAKHQAQDVVERSSARPRHVPALRFPFLTRFYDRIMGSLFDEQALQGRLVEQARVTHFHTVLDLGCGTGAVALRVANGDCHRVFGLDADFEAILVGARKAKVERCPISWCIGSAAALPFRDSAFDRVLSSLLLHHLSPAQKRAALAGVQRVLREGGELHVMDWGKATGPLMRLAFLPVQMLDGFVNTAENVRGLVSEMIEESALKLADPPEPFRTALGVIEFHRAFK